MRNLTVLSIHNFYQQSGGEDRVFEDEKNLLRRCGHEVVTYTRTNLEIAGGAGIRTALGTVWNGRSYSAVRRLIQENRVDVVHCHNTFPLISPSVYWAAGAEGVPVIQTVHNYRMMCAAATLQRDGHVCEDCVTQKSPLPALRFRCYRGSLAATGVLCAANEVHRSLGSWQRKVTRFIALTRFMREKLIEAEIPPERIRLKPNTMANDPGVGRGDGKYVLFAGRLSSEKGVRELCEAWMRDADLPELIIAGDGPMRETVLAATSRSCNVTWKGHVPAQEVVQLMKGARFLIVPSTWYEGFGMVVAEAYAAGLPVLASRIGALAEIVRESFTGWLFQPGDVADMIRTIRMAVREEGRHAEMRRAARADFEELYSAEKNCGTLLAIYDEVLREMQAEWRQA